jgi:D-threo-aldose 1-dehydrogenase
LSIDDKKGFYYMQNKIEQRQVGKTDLSIPQLGVGTAPFGNRKQFGDVAEENAQATVARAFEIGMRFVDTAPLYSEGYSESTLGQILPNYPRDSYVLATKIGNFVTPEKTIVKDYSRDSILRSIEDSLKRMNVDSIDIIHIHDADTHEDGFNKAMATAYPTLAELREQKVIKAIGAGMNQWEMLYEFGKAGDFDCFLLAGRYTLLEQKPLETFFPFCQEKNISIILGGIYNSGILATGAVADAKFQYANAPQNVIERVQSIERVCTVHGVPLQVVAFQFAQAHPAVTSMIIGLRNVAEVNSIVTARDTVIPAAFWDELKHEGLIDKNAPVPMV